jgi:glycosyltransferase involved in cell wall biosynthesis
VIIPTFNRSNTIVDAVQSVMDQTYGSIEIIVVDDGSTDATLEKLRDFSSRITLLRQQNEGPSAARNHGVKAATGEILAFLDSDDTWLPEKISRQVALMEACGKEMTCCICNASIEMGPGAQKTDSFLVSGICPSLDEGIWRNPADVLSSRFILFNQVAAIRRDAFVRLGGYSRRFRLLEDYDLALRLAARGGTWGIISSPLVVKRNDTRGIGVECCNDRMAHAKALRTVLTGVFESGVVRHPQMRRNIRRRLCENAREIRSCELMERNHWPVRSLGVLMGMQARAIRYASRHLFPLAEPEVEQAQGA